MISRCMNFLFYSINELLIVLVTVLTASVCHCRQLSALNTESTTWTTARAGGRTPTRTPGRGGGSGAWCYVQKNVSSFLCFQPPPYDKLLATPLNPVHNTQIQSIRQILPLSLDIPMLKSSQLQAPSGPLDPAGGSAPRPPLYIKHVASVAFVGGGAPTL